MKLVTTAEQLLLTTVKIDCSLIDGKKGSGTGFVFGYKLENKILPFIVTNKHVIKNTVSTKITFHQGANLSHSFGKAFQLEVPNSPHSWFGHLDEAIDIAICPLWPLLEAIKNDFHTEIFYKSIGSELMPTKEQLDSLDAVEKILFIGYPNGLWDTANFLPIARHGYTASHPNIDFNNRPLFIIDASVFGGSSGSPVFIYDKGSYTDKLGNTVLAGNRLIFLGVIAAVYFKKSTREIQTNHDLSQETSSVVQKEMIDLGIVFKARVVVETIEAAVSKYGIT